MDQKDWRDAKMAQWAKDAAQAEIDQWKLTAALSWPTEAKPEPLPFRWVEYDRQIGEPVPGRYWCVPHYSRVGAFDLARLDDIPEPQRKSLSRWKKWVFGTGTGWTSRVIRGPLFATEHEARLYRRWLMCEDFAGQLLRVM